MQAEAFITPAEYRPGRARAAAGVGARRGQRSALFRRLRQPGGGQVLRRHHRLGQPRRRLHHAGHEPAACRARRGPIGFGEGGRGVGEAAPQGSGPGAGGADRRRSAHRRDPGAGRRALLQPVAVQPRDHVAAPARLGVQAVRLPGRLRARGADRRARPHGRLADARRARHLRLQRRDLGAAQLRRLRRRDHLAARAGDVAQPRHHPRRRAHRLRHRSRSCGARSASASRRAASRRSRSACSS